MEGLRNLFLLLNLKEIVAKIETELKEAIEYQQKSLFSLKPEQ